MPAEKIVVKRGVEMYSKEEINLCRQVAEKYRKEIVFGDWYSDYRDDSIGLYQHEKPLKDRDKVFPLWTISDCLKWLKERYDDVDVGSIQGEWEVQVHDAYDRVHHPEFLEDVRGKTPLEACLKAVLAVVEEKKK